MRFPGRALLLVALLTAALGAGAATVTGTVRNTTGTPLGGMVVAAYDTAGELQGTATTDGTGFYAMTSLPTGSYRLLAYDPAGVYATAFDGNAESFETSPVQSISSSGAQVSFTLETGGIITGTVQSGIATPRPNMLVEAYNLSGTRRGFTTTNAFGDYTLVLPPAEYKIVAYDPNGAWAARFHTTSRSFADATPVRVNASATTNVSFTLTAAAIVGGGVFDAATALPLRSISVYAYTPNGALVASTVTNAGGEYRFSLPAGDYRFVAADNARVYANAFYGNSRSFESSITVIVLAAEQRGNVHLVMTRGARITGRVSSANLIVAAYNVDGSLHMATTSGANGIYALLVAPGDYRIAVSDPSMAHATLFYGGTPLFRLAQTVHVAGDVADIDVTLPRGGRIRGTIRAETTSLPLAGMTVAAYDAAGNLITSATTGTDGRYAMVLAPGAYRLVAFDTQLNYATSFAGGAPSFETTGPVAVQADAMITTDFPMRRGVRVTGTVAHQGGGDVTAVEVFALDASGNRAAGAIANDGAFTIVVAPGTYRFVAVDPLRRYASGAPTGEMVIVQGQTPLPVALTVHGFGRRRAVRK
ncbi:MAG TPA: carboxypeptidase regulatory-like domain-containing protein [Thermoanaerobaculia bacterium]|nr:carboxypeptidase regulatory-like domain-containing protein [Thermoanaerobaculia bacterium]